MWHLEVKDGHVHDLVVVILRAPETESPDSDRFVPDVRFRDFMR